MPGVVVVLPAAVLPLLLSPLLLLLRLGLLCCLAAALEDYGCLSFAIFENSTKLSVVCWLRAYASVWVCVWVCVCAGKTVHLPRVATPLYLTRPPGMQKKLFFISFKIFFESFLFKIFEMNTAGFFTLRTCAKHATRQVTIVEAATRPYNYNGIEKALTTLAVTK